jgi:hypothetical protein
VFCIGDGAFGVCVDVSMTCATWVVVCEVIAAHLG